jgi:hypothetical protein
VRRLAAASAAALGALLAACAQTTLGTPIPVPTGERSITLTADLAGTTAHAPINDLVHVILPGTGWVFGSQVDGVIVPVGEPVTTPGTDCAGTVLRAGCSSTTTTYRADRAGTTVISATRSSCGAAAPCAGAEGDIAISLDIGHD